MTTTLPSSDLDLALQLVEVKPGLKFSKGALIELLPDIETTLFFAKTYDLDAAQLARLLTSLHGHDAVIASLLTEGVEHSNVLQDYLVDDFLASFGLEPGAVSFVDTPPPAVLLPHLWEAAQIEVAASIAEVAAKLSTTLGRMPGKEGRMVFKTLAQMNAKRPTVGDYKAAIVRTRRPDNLVVLDVSGSMTTNTVRTIADDVVALGMKANAHLAIVSNTVTHWEPGTYSSRAVLAAAEFGGTRYEQLRPLFDRDWGVVVTIADYDSSPSARAALAKAPGRIERLLDISLVNRPTYLATCLGQLASKVEPLLIGDSDDVLR